MAADPLLELGGEVLDPAMERDVIDLNAAVGQHALEVSIADRELQIPAHRPQDDLGRKAEAAKHPSRAHPWRSSCGLVAARRSHTPTRRRSTQRSRSRDNGGNGIFTNDSDPIDLQATFIGNLCTDNDNAGLAIRDAASGGRFHGNIVTGNDPRDIEASVKPCDNIFRGNVFGTDNETGADAGPGPGCIQ